MGRGRGLAKRLSSDFGLDLSVQNAFSMTMSISMKRVCAY